MGMDWLGIWDLGFKAGFGFGFCWEELMEVWRDD